MPARKCRTILCTRWFWQERSQGYKVIFHAKFGGPFHRKITWAGTVLIEDCNRRNCVLVIYSLKWSAHWWGSDVCNWSQFSRDCKNWTYKDLKLKWCRQRIWLRGKTGRQNSTLKLNLIGCLFVSRSLRNHLVRRKLSKALELCNW